MRATENDEAVNTQTPGLQKTKEPCRFRLGKILLFVALAVVWFVFDRITKQIAESFAVGAVFVEPLAGLFQFRLVHNTGAAWSMLSDATLALGVFGVVFCVAIVAVVLVFARYLSLSECAFLGLIVAGGLGNAVDRFCFGYVIDFIQPLFVSFPTFNVADTGVTCGIVLFACSYLIRSRKEGGR